MEYERRMREPLEKSRGPEMLFSALCTSIGRSEIQQGTGASFKF